ncbi:MAG: DUF1643 domain-containing protein, partial [Steroidobacteraceae bacterium]
MTNSPWIARPLPVPMGTKSRAWFSHDQRHRFLLIRELEQPSAAERKSWRAVLFVLLNPSAATEQADDRTIAKCWRLTRRWGGTEMRICNVYGLRASSPKDLWTCVDPVGTRRDTWLRRAVEGFGDYDRAELIVLGWGNHPREEDLVGVHNILRCAAGRVFALATTLKQRPQ